MFCIVTTWVVPLHTFSRATTTLQSESSETHTIGKACQLCPTSLLLLAHPIHSVLVMCRAQYEPLEDLLGPHFAIRGRRYRRDDLNIVNARGHILMCSFYRPHTIPDGVQLPCVIYNHGNR